MGVAHLLDADGATDELAGSGKRRPLLTRDRLAYLGLGTPSAYEREQIAARGLRAVDLDTTIADPEGAAQAALALLDGSDEIAVHFDVDVLDFLDAPLAENTDREPGVPLASAGRALRDAARRRPRPRRHRDGVQPAPRRRRDDAPAGRRARGRVRLAGVDRVDRPDRRRVAAVRGDQRGEVLVQRPLVGQ